VRTVRPGTGAPGRSPARRARPGAYADPDRWTAGRSARPVAGSAAPRATPGWQAGGARTAVVWIVRARVPAARWPVPGARGRWAPVPRPPRLALSPRSPALFIASGPVRPVHRVRSCSSRFSSHRGPTRASGPAVARPAVRPPAPRHPRTARLLRRGSGTPASGVHLARPFRWPVGTRLTGRRPRAERRPNPPAHSPPCIPPAVPGVRRQRGHGASHRPPEPGRAAVRPARPTPRAGRQHRVRRTTLRSRPRGEAHRRRTGTARRAV